MKANRWTAQDPALIGPMVGMRCLSHYEGAGKSKRRVYMLECGHEWLTELSGATIIRARCATCEALANVYLGAEPKADRLRDECKRWEAQAKVAKPASTVAMRIAKILAVLWRARHRAVTAFHHAEAERIYFDLARGLPAAIPHI